MYVPCLYMIIHACVSVLATTDVDYKNFNEFQLHRVAMTKENLPGNRYGFPAADVPILPHRHIPTGPPMWDPNSRILNCPFLFIFTEISDSQSKS